MSERDPMQRSGPSRREFLALGLGAFVVTAVPWAASRRRDELVRRSIPVMGTVAEIAVVHGDEARAQAAIEAAFAELRMVESTMSRFRADSDVGRANLGAATGPVVVSAATAAVLMEALRWASASDGQFDPALGRAVALWSVGSRQAPPATDEFRRFAGQRLFEHLEVGRRGSDAVVRFHESEMAVDLGGIAKGYAVDRAVTTLRSHGIRHALVNAGGDLYALGRSPRGDAWQVGVRSPHDPTGLSETMPLEDRALATSGDYEQYFMHGGRRYHHLLDPSTGEPRVGGTHSVTVAAASCLDADAGATAVFGRELGEGQTILARAGGGAEIVHLT
jgi:FAD:protein FMN transferase